MPATIAAARAGVTTGEWAQRAARRVRRLPRADRRRRGGGRAAGDRRASPSCATRSSASSEALGRRLKILVGKPGLDGHSNGAEQIAVRARDVGMEVVYEGIRLTPAQIARSALDEGVHVIGLSILSGSHRELIPGVIEALREAGGGDVPVVVGGIIPEADVEPLQGGRRRRGLHAEGLRPHADHARHRRARRGAQRRSPRTTAAVARRVTAGAALGARLRARDLERGARGAEPRREPRAGAARGDRGAARRGLAGRARRRGAGARRRRHRAARAPASRRCCRALVARLAGARADGRGARRRPVLASARAARCSATARGSTPTPPTAASSSARWPPASGSAGSRRPPARPRRRSRRRSTSSSIETVGVGQSETEVAEVADTVAVVVQPGSGDVLQFLKAGIMEIPDVLVVTKADLGTVADARAARPARRAALARRARDGGRRGVLVPPPTGIDELVDALDAHRAGLDLAAARARARRRLRRAGRLRRRARRARPARARRPPRGGSAGWPSRTRRSTSRRSCARSRNGRVGS